MPQLRNKVICKPQNCLILDCPKERFICQCETELCKEHHDNKLRLELHPN